MIENLNDGSQRAPRLRRDINWGTLLELPLWSSVPKAEGLELMLAIKEAGYEGVQGGKPELCREAGLASTGSFRTSEPGVVDTLVKDRKEKGYEALSTHVGWGMESDALIDAYVNEVLAASQKYNIPVFIETHRATMCQDIWRTVEMVNRHPEIRFNGDFSHWYTGLEMPYGSIDEKLNFLEPVFQRTRFFHGRIGDSCNIQTSFKEDEENVATFKEMWTRSMVGFLTQSKPGDVLPFNPELLPPSMSYARTFLDHRGEMREECDRWEQALLMSDIAEGCFEEALKRVEEPLLINR
jgi:hypothetical protein